jgi:hypothetical protein
LRAGARLVLVHRDSAPILAQRRCSPRKAI